MNDIEILSCCNLISQEISQKATKSNGVRPAVPVLIAYYALAVVVLHAGKGDT